MRTSSQREGIGRLPETVASELLASEMVRQARPNGIEKACGGRSFSSDITAKEDKGL
jgi:hypothetical protein